MKREPGQVLTGRYLTAVAISGQELLVPAVGSVENAPRHLDHDVPALATLFVVVGGRGIVLTHLPTVAIPWSLSMTAIARSVTLTRSTWPWDDGTLYGAGSQGQGLGRPTLCLNGFAEK